MTRDEEVEEFIKKYFKEPRHIPDNIHNLEPTSFDDFATAFIIDQLGRQKNRCLKDRHETWQTISGFIDAHLFWFDQLKNR